MSTKVYIAGSATVFPEPLCSRVVADHFYPPHACSERTSRLARRVAGSFGIQTRTVCLDLQRIPQKTLSGPSQHPLAWCAALVRKLGRIIPLHEVGYVGVAFNTTLHTNTLPNLACQTIMECGLTPEVAPEEFSNYGCAGGFFPLQSAVQYCRRNEKAAIVITFDQCTAAASFCYDPEDPMFSMDLKINLLFSDGAAAMLLVPERMRHRLPGPLPVVEDLRMAFRLSEAIRFDDTRFILGDAVKQRVPPIVASSVIRPVLRAHGLQPSEIAEWSLHQGGREVLARFGDPKVLGLSDAQLARSSACFERFGNLSSPSCFFVFDSFFNDAARAGRAGMMVGFGAGLYLGSMLYRWE